MSDEQAASKGASVETRAETTKSPREFTEHWLTAIDLAGKDEEAWRRDAEDTLKRYAKSKPKQFNVLYANTQTTIPALYNSEPAPDVRRRFGDDDEAGEAVASILERSISIQSELYDFDACMKSAVKDRQIQGRGVTRVRVVVGEAGSKHIECEPVVWDDFRRGPAKMWRDVPWIAFRHRYTREELVDLSPAIGKKVKLDAVIDGSPKKDAEKTHDIFKRATVWEVWDRAVRQVYWFAESWRDSPLKIEDDVYKLREFFPVPRPMYQVERTDTLVPLCEFMIWKPLADEVDTITARISGIVGAMRYRGMYDGAFEAAVKNMANLEDGQLAPAADAARAMQQGGIDKAVWLWPLDVAIKAVQGLYEAREQAKNSLYEMTGVADILRGSTQASETATAQQIKAQWGSLRLQEAQREVQRYARDLYRLIADLTGETMELPELVAMTGIQIGQPIPQDAPPEVQMQIAQANQQMAARVSALLKQDLLREFAVEIETDSTIRADLTRAQQNVAEFVQGFGSYIQSVGPAVQAGMMPGELAVKLLQSFARNFKLGREAEAVMDEWADILEQKAKEPPPKSPEQQKAEMEMAAKQQEMQAAQVERQQELQFEQQKQAMEMEAAQAKLQIEREKLNLQREKMQLDAQAAQQKAALDAQAAQQQHAFSMQSMQEEAEFTRRDREANAQHEDSRRASEMEFMRQKQAMKPQGAQA